MYKVIIIDDEPIIAEGLRKSVDWGSFGCAVEGTAFSGEEGLKLIREAKPDIIFTDIRMPGMDGLTMIAAVRSEFPGTQIAILTGYRDFDYAQRAIRLGVTRFLLKPSKMDEIREALSVMTARLRERREQKKVIAFSREVSADEKGFPDAAEVCEARDGGAQETSFPEAGAFENTENGRAVKAGDGVPEAVASEGAVGMDHSLPESETDHAAGSFLVKNAVSYMEEHCREKLKLSDVADQVYVSQWHLSKLLNRYLGQNFSEILNGTRIEKAKEMLKDPALRIGDIAEEVGFSDMAHFSRVFKKVEGISANEYRNKL